LILKQSAHQKEKEGKSPSAPSKTAPAAAEPNGGEAARIKSPKEKHHKHHRQKHGHADKRDHPRTEKGKQLASEGDGQAGEEEEGDLMQEDEKEEPNGETEPILSASSGKAHRSREEKPSLHKGGSKEVVGATKGTPSKWSVGDKCLAKYSGDGVWYEAVILEKSAKGSKDASYRVQYTEYEGVEEVSSVSIMPLKVLFSWPISIV